MQDLLKPFRAWTPAAVTGSSCPPISAFSLSAFQLFASWPVEQHALGLLLLGSDFDQAVNAIRATWPGVFSIVIGPTYSLSRLQGRPAILAHRPIKPAP
jgi:hypothetical protein